MTLRSEGKTVRFRNFLCRSKLRSRGSKATGQLINIGKLPYTNQDSKHVATVTAIIAGQEQN